MLLLLFQSLDCSEDAFGITRIEQRLLGLTRLCMGLSDGHHNSNRNLPKYLEVIMIMHRMPNRKKINILLILIWFHYFIRLIISPGA